MRTRRPALLATTACGGDPVSSANASTTPSLARGDAAAQSVAGSPHDDAAIQQLVSGLDAAWTSGDYERYAGFYAGAEWVGPDGTVLTDVAEITARYRFVFNVLFPHSRRISSIRRLTFLTGTIAVLDLNATALLDGRVIPRAREKNILIKRGGEWQIVRHQQTRLGDAVQF